MVAGFWTALLESIDLNLLLGGELVAEAGRALAVAVQNKGVLSINLAVKVA